MTADTSTTPTDRLHTRLTQAFALRTPIVLAPMALASGGALAAACANAGALGLVGGGYGELEWTQREYTRALTLTSADPAARRRIGCGFITWKLQQDASALDWILDRPADERPAAVMLSFGDASRHARRVVDAGLPLLLQVQRVEELGRAVELGARVVIVQGGEAGGHGMQSMLARGTFTLVPEAADWLAAHAPNIMLLAAGGVADGRTLAAARVLGADGALVGSRLWATRESLAAEGAKQLAASTPGDGTARSAVFDILRRKDWPAPYDFRAIRNDLHRRWEDRIDELRADPAAARIDYDAGVVAGDFTRAHATVGEATGLIDDVPNAASMIERLHTQALHALSGGR